MIGRERIILVGGPGGVGKTTLAATLGVRFAEAGERTLVLTVDPAKRLAQALGFSHFSSETQKVEIPHAPSAPLYATMLDTQRYFDKVIERFATSERQKQKILGNPIYQTMVESLGGTHEYAAMERLYELSVDRSWDRIIVDTPPMQNAIDLLRAPERLAAFMDNSVLRWFQSGKSLSRLIMQTTSRLAIKLMRTLFGKEFLFAFEELMTDFEGLQYGFQERHRAVEALLKSQDTAFLLVTFPSEERFRESVLFKKELTQQNMQLKGLVLNRVEPTSPSAEGLDLSSLSGADRTEVNRWLCYHEDIAEQQRRWIKEFQTLAGAAPLRIIERSGDPIHRIDALSRIGRLLIES